MSIERPKSCPNPIPCRMPLDPDSYRGLEVQLVPGVGDHVRPSLSASQRMFASKLRKLPSRILSQLGSPARTAMTDIAEAGVATTESWPVSVKNINQNLVTAQYAGNLRYREISELISRERQTLPLKSLADQSLYHKCYY